MSTPNRSQIIAELFPEELKAKQEEGKRELKRDSFRKMSEFCLMYEYEEMGTRLARLVDHGYWSDDVGDADPSARRAQPSVYDSDTRYFDVMAQVAVFLNEQGRTSLGAKCARCANWPDLSKHRSANREEQDKEGLVHSKEEEGDDVAKGEDWAESAFDEDWAWPALDDDWAWPALGEEADTPEPLDIEEEDTGEDEQAAASAAGEPLALETQASPPVPIGEDPGAWPVGGFADDDPAAAYMIDILARDSNRVWHPLTLADVVVFPTTEGDKDLRPYQQVLLRGHNGTGDNVANHNFIFPCPNHPERVMGKVDCSKMGLTLILQGLRKVVGRYDGMVHIPSTRHHVDRLIAANGEMEYNLPLEENQTYYVMAEPYTPEGARSALAALQAGVRLSTSGYVLFYIYPVDMSERGDKLGAVVDVHPIIGWAD